jgi:transcriptional regulator with XRE-family HTH domain
VPEAWQSELLTLWQRLRTDASATVAVRVIARRSGYSPGFVSEVFRGRKRPSPEAAAAITQALGGSANEVTNAGLYAERMRDSPVRELPDLALRPARAPIPPAPVWPLRIGAAPPSADCVQQRPLIEHLPATGASSDESTIILAGLAGTGKSQIVLSHAEDLWHNKDLDLLLWVSATHNHTIVAAYAEAARTITGVDDQDDAVAARRFLSWAGGTARRWLIVLDDLAAPGAITGLWPPASPSGRILVTTRRRDAALAGPGRRFVNVEPFTPGESLAYLSRKFTDQPQRLQGAEHLANDLGHLPIALSQAAAYIIDRELTCASYRERLTQRRARLTDLLPEPDALPDDHRTVVTAVWSLSLLHADRLRPKGLARPLLEIAAFLDSDGIPVELFDQPAVREYLAHRRPGPASPISFTEASDALSNLRRLSLVTLGGSRVHVHALVQRATREGLSPRTASRAALAAADALDLLWVGLDRYGPDEGHVRSHALRLQANAGDLLFRRRVPPVMFRVTASLGRSGQVSAAIRHAQELTASATRLLGDKHPDLLRARADLAFWHGEAGSPTGAADAAEQLVSDCSRTLGPHHRQTFTARHHHAGWHGRAGEPKKAVEKFENLLADRVRVLGPDDPDTLNNRNSLAAWRGYAGDPHSAVTELRAVLTDRARLLGPSHPDTLDTRHHLAHWLGEAGDPDGAAEALSDLLQLRHIQMGEDHRDTLATRYRLALWTGTAGRVEQAIRDLKLLLPDCVRVLGQTAPDTLTVRRVLAEFVAKQGNTRSAVQMLEDVLTDQQKILEPEHPELERTRVALATWQEGDSDHHPDDAVKAPWNARNSPT